MNLRESHVHPSSRKEGGAFRAPWMPKVAQVLAHALTSARQNNPNFSQRALARRCGLSSSAISEILNHKRTLSRASALRLFERLGVPAQELEPKLEGMLGARDISVDQFNLIADSIHFTLLSWLDTKGARPTVLWASERLGVSEDEVRNAFERLARLGLVSAKGADRYVLRTPQTRGPDEIPSAAVKRFHQEGLLKAERALFDVPLEERDFQSVILAIPRARIPEAKKKIRSFLAEFETWIESSSEKDSVYRIGLQLFPLSKISKKTKEVKK